MNHDLNSQKAKSKNKERLDTTIPFYVHYCLPVNPVLALPYYSTLFEEFDNMK